MATDKANKVGYRHRGRKERFQLNTNGCCFICFKPVSAVGGLQDEDDNNAKKSKSGREDEGVSKRRRKGEKAIYSLGYLCRHLKLDVIKILSRQTGSSSGVGGSRLIPAEVVPSLAKSDVRVSLCERCGGTVAKLSSLFREVEMLRMKMGHCLEVIQRWIKETDGDAPVVGQFQRLMASDINTLLYLGIVEELRKEVGVKCSEAVAETQPRVNLTKHGVNAKKPRRKKNSPKKVKLEPEVLTNQEENPTVKPARTPVTIKVDPSPSPAPKTFEEVDLVSPPPSRSRTPTPAPTLTKEQPKIEQQSSPQRTTATDFNCTFCQQRFNSLEEVEKHFEAVHLTSIQVRLSARAQENRGRELINTHHPFPAPRPSTSVAAMEVVKMSKMPRHDSDIKIKSLTTVPPCKMPQPQVFQRGDSRRGSRPLEELSKMVYMDQPPLAVDSNKTNENANPNPAIGDHVCTDCGQKFLYAGNLILHKKAYHHHTASLTSTMSVSSNPNSPSPSKQSRMSGTHMEKNNLDRLQQHVKAFQMTAYPEQRPSGNHIISAIEPIILEFSPSPSTTTTSYSSIPSYEAETSVGMEDQDPEIETACVDMMSSADEYSQGWNGGAGAADPLADLAISDFTGVSSSNPSRNTTDQFGNPLQQLSMMQQNFQLSTNPFPIIPPAATVASTQPTAYHGLAPPIQGCFSINSFTGKPECRLCGVQCADQTEFWHHYNQTHQVLLYDCELCGNRFTHQEGLHEHRRKFHNIQNQVDSLAAITLNELLSSAPRPDQVNSNTSSYPHPPPAKQYF